MLRIQVAQTCRTVQTGFSLYLLLQFQGLLIKQKNIWCRQSCFGSPAPLKNLGYTAPFFVNFLTVCVLFRMQEETGKLSLKLGSLSKVSYMVQNCIQHIGPNQTIVGLPRHCREIKNVT